MKQSKLFNQNLKQENFQVTSFEYNLPHDIMDNGREDFLK